MKKKHWSYIFWVSCILGTLYMYLSVRAEEKGLFNGNDIFYSKLGAIAFGMVCFISNLASAENEEQRYGRLFGILATVIIAISKYL